MKRFLTILALCLCSLGAFAQNTRFPEVDEIAQIEVNDVVAYEVFCVTRDGLRQYYFCVGNLGIGDDVLQVMFDPVYKLYIPLGSTFAEAMEHMQQLKIQVQNAAGTRTEWAGNFAPLLPTEERETVTVTTRKGLFCRRLEFSLERDGYIRSTSVSKSDLNNLLFNLKLNSKRYENR